MSHPSMGLVPALDGTFARNVPGFFPDPVRRRIATVAGALPAFATDFFGFEIHLGTRPGSDFLVCIDAGPQVEALSQGLRRAPPSPDPIWSRLAAFCEAWAGRDGDPVWRTLVHNLWLEFDLAQQAGDEPVPRPSLFLGTHHLDAGSDPARADAISAALDRLEGAAPSAGRRQALRRALAALPPGGRLFQIGLMLARGDERVRICAKGLGPTEAVAYLDRLGCPRTRGLADLVAAAAQACQEIRLAFDATADTVSGRVGLECYPGGDGDAGRWPDLCRLVMESGLLAAADAGALTGWMALIHQRLVEARTADWLDAHPARPSRTAEGAIHRWIHHLKLTFDPAGATTLKMYLAAQACWFEAPDFAALVRDRFAAAHAEPTLSAPR